MLTDKVFRMLIAFLLESGGYAVPMLKSEINLTEQDVTEFEDAVRTIIAGYLASDEDTQQMIFSLGLDSGLLVSGAGAPEVSALRLPERTPQPGESKTPQPEAVPSQTVQSEAVQPETDQKIAQT